MNIKPLIVLLSALVLAACGGGGGDDSSAGKGALSVRLTDAPVDDAAHVYLSISGISLKSIDDDDGLDLEDDGDEAEDIGGSDDSDDEENAEDTDGDGGWVDYAFDETPPQVDLLTLQSGSTFGLLEGEEITAGSYKIRLNLNFDDYTIDELAANTELVNPPNSIVIDANDIAGSTYELKIPSGQQTGLKLNSTIEVEEDGSANYTIDFDVRKSIVERGNGSSRYLLKPVLRLVKNDESGGISGIIDPNVVELVSGCSDSDPMSNNVVYVFEGDIVDFLTNDPSAGDYLEGSDGPQAVTTANVEVNDDSEYVYTAAFLEEGSYTVAFTCQADSDGLETDDDLNFQDVKLVTVEADLSDDDDADDDIDS